MHPDAGLWVEDRGNGFFYGHCDSCPYLSTRRRTADLAAETVQHHVLKYEQAKRAAGTAVPRRTKLSIELRRTSGRQEPSE